MSMGLSTPSSPPEAGTAHHFAHIAKYYEHMTYLAHRWGESGGVAYMRWVAYNASSRANFVAHPQLYDITFESEGMY